MNIHARRIALATTAAAVAGTAAIALSSTPSSAAQQTPPTNRAYTATSFYIAMGTAQRKVVAVNVPAGAYTVTVRLNPANSSGVDQFACDVLAPDGSVVDDAFVTSDAGTAGFASSTLTLVGAFTSTTQGPVAAKCSDSGQDGQMGINTINVTQVGSVDHQR